MRVEAETNIWHSKNPHVKVCVCTIFIKWQILILALKLQQHCTGFCNCCDLLFGSSKNRGQIWMHFVSDANTSKLGTAPPSGIWREWRLWREVLSKTEATRTTRLATTGVDRNPSEPPPPSLQDDKRVKSGPWEDVNFGSVQKLHIGFFRKLF